MKKEKLKTWLDLVTSAVVYVGSVSYQNSGSAYRITSALHGARRKAGNTQHAQNGGEYRHNNFEYQYNSFFVHRSKGD